MRNLYNDTDIRPFTLNALSDVTAEGKKASFESYFDKSAAKKKDNDEKDMLVKDEEDIEAETRRIFEDAYKEGEKAGFEVGMKKVEPLARRLSQDIAALSSFKKELYDKSEKMSVELALIFAEAIVLQECSRNRDIIINMAKKALEICEEKQEITVRIRRDDIKFISEDALSSLKIIPDDSLKEPGFIIESNFGDIDGTISIQIEELKKQFCGQDADR